MHTNMKYAYEWKSNYEWILNCRGGEMNLKNNTNPESCYVTLMYFDKVPDSYCMSKIFDYWKVPLSIEFAQNWPTSIIRRLFTLSTTFLSIDRTLKKPVNKGLNSNKKPRL